jgi:translation initiation factor 1
VSHVIDTSGGAKLTHNPFAALAGAPSEPAPVPAETAPAGAMPDAEPIRFAPKVVVRREKKGRGGKTVTRIAGIDAAHRERVAGRMKSALGCGAVVEDEDVVLLGALVDRAADWLEAQGARRVVRS